VGSTEAGAAADARDGNRSFAATSTILTGRLLKASSARRHEGRVSKMETFVGYCQMVEATQCAMEADKERE
jgi:hypothetical protein